MSERSRWGLGQKAWELLTARQAGYGPAAAGRGSHGPTGGHADGPVDSTAEGPVRSTAGDAAAGRASSADGAASGTANGASSAPLAAPATANGAAAEPNAAIGAHAAATGRAADTGILPRWLQLAAAWSWRLLLIGIVLYLAYLVASRLSIVVVPCAAAVLFTALLQPLASRLHRTGLPMLAAAWCTLLGAVIVLAGIITLVTVRVRAEYPGLLTQIRRTSRQLENLLAGPPLHLTAASLQSLSDKLLSYLEQHKSVVAGTVLTGGQIVFEVLGGIVLMLFVTFFLLKDGERIWGWLLHAARPGNRQRFNRAGHAAWQTVVYYMRGTVLVAAIHAVVIGATLTIMGVPLVAALAVLVFVGAFIPLVGILFAGAFVILITLAAKGWLAAIIVLCVFVAEDQLESHLLQPLVVGRFVRLHPLAIILVLAVGGVVAGIPGAVVAVPVAAVITRVAAELRRRGEPGEHEEPAGPAVGSGSDRDPALR